MITTYIMPISRTVIDLGQNQNFEEKSPFPQSGGNTGPIPLSVALTPLQVRQSMLDARN